MSSSPDSSAGLTAINSPTTGMDAYFATIHTIVRLCMTNLMSFLFALIIRIGAFYRWIATDFLQALPVLVLSTAYFVYRLKEQYEYDIAIFFARSFTYQIDVRVLPMVCNKELTSPKRLFGRMATCKQFSSSISCINTSDYGNRMTIWHRRERYLTQHSRMP